MRTLWPKLDGEDGLETVLEVPIPEEMFASCNTRNPWRTIKSWLMMRPPPSSDFARRAAQIQFLLQVIGAPLIPLPITSPQIQILHHHNIKPHHHPIERSMASYIVQQYIAAAGGQHALNSIQSMCAIGQVKMGAASEIDHFNSACAVPKMKLQELGSFVLWQKTPHLWSLDLMLSGFKITAGSDGQVAWWQTPSHHSRRAPTTPLRRSLQGLDPRSTADLFFDSVCTGEKTINGEDCFVLKLEAEAPTQRERSVEIIKHTIWGYFSQKTGLLVQLQDSHSLRLKSSSRNEVVWETKMESLIQDYRTIDGVNIAHGGRTTVLLFDAESCHTRTRMEEVWSIEELDFNVKGLSTDCFLPPADLNKDDDDQECGGIADCDSDNYGRLTDKALDNSTRICGSRSGRKVVAIDEEDLELEVYDSDDDELYVVEM
ncbi:replication factor C subunit [Perilla frutescens var. hirtella]|uniref:Replication factor C subunit n=1 Tax=Perilla frutescens var. hirtella TaxID=608512 RepID=A0AAD4P549_PERFH|nr:replication factor C subunit [Perilla frutescens var. hirtella]